MKRLIYVLAFSFVLLGCKSSKNNKNYTDKALTFSNTITSEELKGNLTIYASDEFEGRMTGTEGQKKAVNFLKNQYIKLGIPSPIAEGDYFQEIPEDYFGGRAKGDSENVVALLKGSEKPDEYIVISAHLDHVGKKNGEIYNGADDDGSGTVAILEIAEAFKEASKKGYTPKRSILFLHVTGEELGLFGSKYYTDVDPILPLHNAVANLNIDMIGRTDPKHELVFSSL